MLGRWFEKKQVSDLPASVAGFSGPRVPRHSGGWSVLRKRLQAEPGLRIIDVGYTSPANINYLTSLGHSVFLADLVNDACSNDWKMGADEDGNPIWNVTGYLEQALNFIRRKLLPTGRFDRKRKIKPIFTGTDNFQLRRYPFDGSGDMLEPAANGNFPLLL